MKKKTIILVILIIICIIIAIIANKKISKYNYETTKVTSYNYFTLISNEKYGVIDRQGNTIISPEYTNIIIPNPEKDIFICYKDEKTEVLNSNEEKLLTEYQNIDPIKLKNVATTLNYEKSVLKFEKDGLYGLIDFDGKVIAKNEYQSIENLQLCEGIFLIKQNDKYGIMNLKGTVIIKPVYDNIISDGYYTEKDGYKKAGYIVSNKTDEGYRYGYITNNGKKYLEANYNYVSRISDTNNEKEVFLIASENGKYGLYKNKKNVIKAEYQSIEYDDSSNLLIIQKNKKYGMANLAGDIVVPLENTSIDIKGIYIYAKLANENKVYDKEGNKININFNKAIYETENENYRISTLENDDATYYGIADKNGNLLVSEKYQYLEYAFGNYFIAKNEEGKYGLITASGKEVLEFKYSLLQKLKGKNILQAGDNVVQKTELYSSNIKLIYELENAKLSNEEGYVEITKDLEKIYLDADGNKIDANAEVVKKAELLKEPDTIGDYKKIQFTLENVYYTKE